MAWSHMGWESPQELAEYMDIYGATWRGKVETNSKDIGPMNQNVWKMNHNQG